MAEGVSANFQSDSVYRRPTTPRKHLSFNNISLLTSEYVRYNPPSPVGKAVGRKVVQQLQKLSARAVATVSKPGRHSDGGGLYLSISPGGARSWVFMWKVAGRRREMGLGSLRDVPLAKARQKAAEVRQKLADGIDPLATRDTPKQMTFGEAADALITSMSSSWRNEKHRAQWKMTLTVYCEPIRGLAVAELGTDDVLNILNPLWTKKAETASRPAGSDRAGARLRAGARPPLGREPGPVARTPRCHSTQTRQAHARTS